MLKFIKYLLTNNFILISMYPMTNQNEKSVEKTTYQPQGYYKGTNPNLLFK